MQLEQNYATSPTNEEIGLSMIKRRRILSNEEDRLKRSRERNKLHARNTRERKKMQMELMQTSIEEMKLEKAALTKQLLDTAVADILMSLSAKPDPTPPNHTSCDSLNSGLTSFDDSETAKETPKLTANSANFFPEKSLEQIKTELEEEDLSDAEDIDMYLENLKKSKKCCGQEELDAIRRERNRMHAKKTRLRKKRILREIELTANQLQSEIDVLREKVAAYERSNLGATTSTTIETTTAHLTSHTKPLIKSYHQQQQQLQLTSPSLPLLHHKNHTKYQNNKLEDDSDSESYSDDDNEEDVDVDEEEADETKKASGSSDMTTIDISQERSEQDITYTTEGHSINDHHHSQILPPYPMYHSYQPQPMLMSLHPNNHSLNHSTPSTQSITRTTMSTQHHPQSLQYTAVPSNVSMFGGGRPPPHGMYYLHSLEGNPYASQPTQYNSHFLSQPQLDYSYRWPHPSALMSHPDQFLTAYGPHSHSYPLPLDPPMQHQHLHSHPGTSHPNSMHHMEAAASRGDFYNSPRSLSSHSGSPLHNSLHPGPYFTYTINNHNDTSMLHNVSIPFQEHPQLDNILNRQSTINKRSKHSIPNSPRNIPFTSSRVTSEVHDALQEMTSNPSTSTSTNENKIILISSETFERNNNDPGSNPTFNSDKKIKKEDDKNDDDDNNNNNNNNKSV